MKKALIIVTLLTCSVAFAYRKIIPASSEPVSIEASTQLDGDPAKGYEYLIYGDFLKNGIPFNVFVAVNGKDHINRLNRTGKSAKVPFGYNVVRSEGVNIVVPTCLQCHAQVFDGKLVMGLGNTYLNFTHTKGMNFDVPKRVLKLMSGKQYRVAYPFIRSFETSYPLMELEAPGVNAADRLAQILVAHRDPQTLTWSEQELIPIPEEIIPTDVPAWWLMKKKNAMFYNGFARGDLTRFLMLANLLTVKDSTEAREVCGHFNDVLAYIRSIEPPKFPKKVDEKLVAEGKVVFESNCSRCHGTYGAGGSYPNLLIPESIIGTDSALYLTVERNAAFTDWFARSWFAQGPNAAHIVPFSGYLAPPLDGVWITAPYLHNGSVPSLEALLNSKLRPRYWKRVGDTYDYESPGIRYESLDRPVYKKSYNTDLRGYGNYGHYFGDALSGEKRKALIEYLKTL